MLGLEKKRILAVQLSIGSMEQDMVVNRGAEDQLIELPPGFRFHPTDEEIITSYLTEKVIDSSFVAIAIGEADLNKCEPWDLPSE